MQINLINSLSKYFPIVKCVIKNDKDIPKTINTLTLPFKNASAKKYVAIEETIINNKSININNTFFILNIILINFRISQKNQNAIPSSSDNKKEIDC